MLVNSEENTITELLEMVAEANGKRTKLPKQYCILVVSTHNSPGRSWFFI